MLTRRQFLLSLAATAGASMIPFRSGFALNNIDTSGKRLVVIMLRGAVDGLSVVVPYRENNYYARRKYIALRPPNEQGGVLNLDGFFGLHPSLASLMPRWQDKTLAFVHASGLTVSQRSHFEAQDMLETASIDVGQARYGWMNNLISVLPQMKSSTRALSLSKELPRIFVGKNNVATVPPGLKPDSHPAFNNPKVEQEFDTLYSGHPELAALFQDAKDSRDRLTDDLRKEMISSGGNAPYPDGFPGEATRLAAMIKQDPTIALAFMDIGGWDTHVNQGNAKGQLADKLGKLGDGLSVFATALGKAYQDTVILVMSEFGRTVSENGNSGTDHGHGNVMWLLGGAVSGGTVYGRWPGLAPNQLFEGRDLAVTTDFRQVISTVLARHFTLDDRQLASVIPGYRFDNSLSDILRSS